MNVLSNVFISSGFNKLQLVDVYFTDVIVKIEPYTEAVVDWADIDNKEKLNTFVNSIEKKKYSDNIIIHDGDYKVLIPGSIDSHVHFNTPGFEERDDFIHASKAAMFGGVTSVFDMPCTSLPPVVSKNNFEFKREAVKNKSYIDYFFWGGIRREDFIDKEIVKKQIRELVECGVVGFKAYVISGMDTFSDLSYTQLKYTAECVKENNSILAVHAEDKELITKGRSLAISQNKNDWQAYCDARDDNAEAKAINNLIIIAKETGCRIHIVHLSSQKGLELIGKARKEGLNITTETCPHYLYFTQKDFEDKSIRNYLKTAPPVKLENDRDALWEGLKDGSISFITTDHAGCNPEKEKISDNFWEVYGGIPGVQHRVQFLFSEGFLKGKIDLESTVRLLSRGVSDVFHLKKIGRLETGYDADFTLLNLYNPYKVKASEMHSKGKYTPFEGIIFDSVIDKVFLRGEMLLDRENLVNSKVQGKLQTII
ncbi:MAG: allantoinase AllB [Ignavibacteria bacterium]|nr:allantoinase AllB [Ignavibacteria bacterium]